MMRGLSAVIIALVVVAAAGCAGGGGSAPMAPTVDVTGKWVGTVMSYLGGPLVVSREGTIELTLTQTGSEVTGNLVSTTPLPWDVSGGFQGRVSGNELRIIQPSSLIGTLSVQGDTMTGQVHGGTSDTVRLRRQK